MRPNKPLLLATLKRVQQAAAVGLWIQKDWVTETDCGTAYCFAGHALDLCGLEIIRDDYGFPRVRGYLDVAEAAQNKLGIDTLQAYDLFAATNDIAYLERKVCAIVCADDDDDPSEIDTRPDPELVSALCDGTGIVSANGFGGVAMDCPYCREMQP